MASNRLSAFGWSLLSVAPTYFGVHCARSARVGFEAGIVYGAFAVVFSALAIGCLVMAWREERRG